MLIAIMGNTFDKVIEKKQVSSLKEKINILNDYRNVNQMLGLERSFQYIFIIKPALKADDGAEWEGKISAIKTSVELAAKQSRAEQAKVNKKLEQKMNDMDSSIYIMKDDMKVVRDEVSSEMQKIRISMKTNQAEMQSVKSDV